MPRRTSLVSTFGRSIGLKSIHIEGQVDGLMAEMAINLHFRNESGNKLEIVYTFRWLR